MHPPDIDPRGGPDMPPVLSGTHLQILSVLATEIALMETPPTPFRILDIGCGDGLLIDYLGHALPILFPNLEVEIHGFDVSDHGVQPQGYFAATIAHLEQSLPGADWPARLKLISEREAWPYEDGFFAAAVSNQVLEHVHDHDLFFAQNARVLACGGVAVHVFPSRHTLIEPHLRIPFAHRFRDAHGMRRMIRLWSSLNRGKFREHKRKNPRLTPDEFAAAHADFLIRYTNFRFQTAYLDAAKAHRLHGTFKYTAAYFVEKLRLMRGGAPRYRVEGAGGVRHGLVSWLGRYVASVTLVLTRTDRYDRYNREMSGDE
ncbi:class I SAM-dependent methyltransferase [Roseovarius spongiae]|nr:class I SAM-dependent methyltransferase [Roseovarius spongiae]